MAMPALLAFWILFASSPRAVMASPVAGTIHTLTGPSASSYLYAIAVSTDGTLAFSDNASYTQVRQIRNGTVTTIVGCQGCPGDGPEGTDTVLGEVSGLAFEADGSLLIADPVRCQVLRWTAGLIAVVGGLQSACGYAGDDGPAIAAQLQPAWVAVAPQGDVIVGELPYYGEGTGCRIRSISNGIISTIAGTGVCTSTGGDGEATSINIVPFAIDVDTDGTIYLVDFPGRIRKIVEGTITTIAGTGVMGYSGDGGDPLLAQVAGPRGLDVASNGDIYLAETGSLVIRKIGDNVITTVAGGGDCCPPNDNDGIPATQAYMFPMGVTVDAYGNIYLVDFSDSRIRVVYGSGACTDGDCDGVLNAMDNCPHTPNEDQLNTDAANTALNRPGADTLGDVCDPDISGDGYGNTAKAALGKNLLIYCPIMRADIDGDGAVSILDLAAVAQRFGQAIPPAPERYAQDADSSVSILDLARMAGVFGQHVSACT